MKKKFSIILALAVGAALTFSGCSASGKAGTSSAASAKTTITIAKQSDPSSLDPHVVTDEAAVNCVENMYSTLFAYTEKYGEVKPSLVESYTLSDDKLTYTFKLHKDVKFHDGKELTSDDVIYSINRIKEKKVRASNFDQVASMTAPDKYTVVIKLSQPFAPLLTYLAQPLNAIVDKAVVDQNGGSLAKADAGSGPYQLDKWDAGTQLTLKKFGGYWESGKPILEKIVYKTMTDATARATALRNGEVDMIADVTDQEISVLNNAPGVTVKSVPGTFWEYLGMNCSHTYLSDVKVRQAIANAIDRDALNTAIKMGRATVLHDANIPATMDVYVNANTYPKQNLDKAKQLLKDAGYSAGQITLKLKVGSDWKYQVDAAQMIKQQLSSIGINVEITAMESGMFFDSLNKGDFDLTVCGWAGFVDPDEYVYNLFKTGGTGNQQKYSNPDLDKLLDLGRTTVDPTQRTQIYKQIQTIVANDAPMAFLYMNNYSVAMRADVQGYIVHPTGTTTSLKQTYFK